MEKPKLLVADFRYGIRFWQHMLEPEYELAAYVSDDQSLLEAEKQMKPDLVIVNLAVSGLGGLETICDLKERGSGVKVIVLVGDGHEHRVTDALAAGVSGCVQQFFLGFELSQAIDQVLAGHTFISPRFSAG